MPKRTDVHSMASDNTEQDSVLTAEVCSLKAKIEERDNIIRELQNLVSNLNNKIITLEKAINDKNTGKTGEATNNENAGNNPIKRKMYGCETNTTTQLIKNRKTGPTTNRSSLPIHEYFLKKTTPANQRLIDKPDDSSDNTPDTLDTEMTDLTKTTTNNTAAEPSTSNTQTNCEADLENNKEWQFVSHRNKKTGSEKIQPLQVDIEASQIASLKESLQCQMGINSFTINQLKSQHSIRIYPNSIETRQSIIKTLKASQHNFHTYLQKEEKRNCFIIRGLNGINDTELVKRELNRAGLPEDITVLLHQTGFQKANPNRKHNTLYKIIVGSAIEEKEIIKVKSLFGFMIKIEKLKTKEITQCTNCQLYFHTAACCYRKYRCVKCTDEHEPGCCKKNTGTDEPQCVNCGEYHTANNHQKCEYFNKNILPIINKRKQTSTKNNTDNKIVPNQKLSAGTSTSIPINNSVTFADTVKGKSANQTNTNKSQTAQPTEQSNTNTNSNNQTMDGFMKALTMLIENQNKIISTFINKNG